MTNKDIRHDLKSALTPVLGYLELLLNKLEKSDGPVDSNYVTEKLKKLLEQSNKIRNLVEQIKD